MADVAHFDWLRSSGLHVQLGVIVGEAKTRRQKEVDVLIAVQMLTHSFRRNMTRAVLIAGDRDFKPVVEAMVANGTDVHVVCDERHGSKDLRNAADSSDVVDVRKLCDWTMTYHQELPKDTFVDKKSSTTMLAKARTENAIRRGKSGVLDVAFYKAPVGYVVAVEFRARYRVISHSNADTLLKYVDACLHVKWLEGDVLQAAG